MTAIVRDVTDVKLVTSVRTET